MGWYTIANNQTVSFSNLQDAVNQGVFVPKASITSTNEQITKGDADAKVYLDTAYAPFANKAENQLVVRSNLRPISYAYTIYYNEVCYYDGIPVEGGAGSAAGACSNPNTITLYSPVASFTAGMKLFYDSICDNPWYGDSGNCGDYYKVIVAGTSYSFSYPDSNSTVSNINTCQTCSCFLLTNTDSIDISISFYDCGGSTLTPECNTCPAGSSIYLCIQDGQHTNYFVSYGTNCGGGATPSYTFTALGTTCNNSGDCI